MQVGGGSSGEGGWGKRVGVGVWGIGKEVVGSCGVENSDSTIKPIVLSFTQDSAWHELRVVSVSFHEEKVS